MRILAVTTVMLLAIISYALPMMHRQPQYLRAKQLKNTEDPATDQ